MCRTFFPERDKALDKVAASVSFDETQQKGRSVQSQKRLVEASPVNQDVPFRFVEGLHFDIEVVDAGKKRSEPLQE